MIDYLGITSPSDNDVWCVALLLYPTRGIEHSEHYIRDLNNESRSIFRDIFENNTTGNRK